MLHAPKPAWLPLGALLVREELISNEQLELALIDQQGTGLRLGELLVQWGWVESAAISRALAEQYEHGFFDLDAAEIDPAAVERLPAAGRAQPRRDPDPLPRGRPPARRRRRPDRRRRLRRAAHRLGGAVSLVVVDQIELHRALAREYTA